MTGYGGTLDPATWQALGVVLTLLGLAVSVLVWRRRGPGHGLRAAAWSLLPLAAGLTGLLRLVGDIVGELVRWATRLAFSPVVWLGVLVAAVALVLFVVSGWLLGKGSAGSAGPAGSAGSAAGAAGAPEPSRRPPVGSGRSDRAAAAPRETDEMDDIEEILRRHGIQ